MGESRETGVEKVSDYMSVNDVKKKLIAKRRTRILTS